MNLSGPHGRNVIKSVLPLFVIIISFSNLLGGPIPIVDQQQDASQTAGPTIPVTLPPSETATPEFTETLTSTVPPSVTAESTSIPTISIQGDFVSDEILIRFRRNASKGAIEACLQTANAFIAAEIDQLAVFRVKVPEGRVAEAMTRLSACHGVRYIEPNYKVSIADTIPSDPDWNLQYGLSNIRAPQGWDLSTGSASVTIAILDTGVDLGHLDLANKIVSGHDFVNNDVIAQDDNGHGTHVAGIAAATSDNRLGVAGVSWGGRLMPVKVLDANGTGTFADVAAGMIWATDQGAQVINLSFGGGNSSQVLQDAVNYADSKGVVLVAAAGNSGNSFVLYPARYPQVIAVAATDFSNLHAGFSNYGPEVDLSAPGESIYSTSIGGYGYLSGTSMSTPFVSGLAAILRGIPGNSSPGAIAWEMESTALDLGAPGFDDFYGHGLIQMDAALSLVLSAPTPTASQTATRDVRPPSTLASTLIPRETLPSASPSLSPAPSATLSPPYPSSELTTVSPTLASTSTLLGGTESAEVIALETLTPGPAKQRSTWILPCSGSFLILLGIFLFWLARSNSGMNRKIKRFQ